MKPSEIGQAYNQIPHLWENEDFNRNNGIKQHEKAIAFIGNRGKALDVGCGCTGRFIDLLLSTGFDPEGIDVSEEMVKLARQRHPAIKFYQKDICEWDVPHKYDFITAWDSIWHIPLNQQRIVLTKLISSLNANGVFIFSCGGTDNEGEHKNNYMGPDIYYSSLGINGFLKLFIELDCTCRHLEYDQYPELHTYFIVQKA
ncbi:MAG: class I SAM-dependent methyltransferase [Cyanobacteria bacterium P01_A01_bin.37]